jgi:DNA-binding NarL/FixJ family response regulator
MYPQEQFAVRAFRAGAAGYLTKAGAPEELVKAIRTVLQGRKYVSPSLAETLAVGIEEKHEKPLHELLSEREYQVMLRLATGQTPTAIAIEMTLSVKTVNTYRLRLLKKLRANNNAELAAYAIRNQLMD